MIRHAVEAFTKNLGRGREAEVNDPRGVGDGQEGCAVVRQGWGEGPGSVRRGQGSAAPPPRSSLSDRAPHIPLLQFTF